MTLWSTTLKSIQELMIIQILQQLGHDHFFDEKSGLFNEKSTQIFSIQDLCQTNILHEGHVINSSFFTKYSIWKHTQKLRRHQL